MQSRLVGRGCELSRWRVRGQDTAPRTLRLIFGEGGMERTLGREKRLDSKPQPLPRFH